MLCNRLEGWDKEGGREMREGGDIHMHIADSLCFTAETNTTLKQLYFNKDVKKFKKSFIKRKSQVQI